MFKRTVNLWTHTLHSDTKVNLSYTYIFVKTNTITSTKLVSEMFVILHKLVVLKQSYIE